MLQAIIFDMDGTLFQTNLVLEQSLEDTFQHLATLGEWEGETPIETYRDIMGVPLPVVWETLLPIHSNKIRKQADAYFLDRLIENISEGKGALYPNAIHVLEQLKARQLDIYIASNGLKKYLQAIVDYYELNRWISETCSIEDIHSGNKTDLVKSIVKRNGLTQAAVVGDRLSDFEAARGNQLLSIGCRFDFSKEEELQQADYIVNDLEDILLLLKGARS